MSYSPTLHSFGLEEYRNDLEDDYLHLQQPSCVIEHAGLDPQAQPESQLHSDGHPARISIADQVLQSEPEFRLLESKSNLSTLAGSSASSAYDDASTTDASGIDRAESNLSEMESHDRAALYALSQLSLTHLRKTSPELTSPARVADVARGEDGKSVNPLETSNGPNTTAIVVPCGQADTEGTTKVASVHQNATSTTIVTTVSSPLGTTTTTTVTDLVTGLIASQSSTTFALTNPSEIEHYQQRDSQAPTPKSTIAAASPATIAPTTTNTTTTTTTNTTNTTTTTGTTSGTSKTPGDSTTNTEVGDGSIGSASSLSLLHPRRRLNLEELNTLVAELLKNGRENANIDAIRSAMERYDASSRDWTKYVFWDSNCKYTRNLIATDGKNYSLMLLCWNGERESPIHNHPRCECFVRVVDGSVVEYRYDWPRPGAAPDDLLRLTSRLDCRPGDVTLMNDSMGLHKLCNMTQCGAVTLHLYFPPYQSCKLFLEGTSTSVIGHMCFHTERGCVVNHFE